MTTTAEKVRDLIAQTMGSPVAAVQPETKLTELGADSLDCIELAMAIEDEFGIEIADDDIAEAATVGQWIALVERETGDA